MLRTRKLLTFAVNVPVCTVAPVVSGTIGQGNVITCAQGTWTNTPTTFHDFWYKVQIPAAPISIGTDSTTYTQQPSDVGFNIYYVEGAVTASGAAGFANSNTVGPVTGSGLATPTLSNYSALGAAPVVLQWTDTDYVVGLYGQLQIATDSGFASIAQNIVFFIDGASWALGSESVGLVTPTGTYYSRIRTCRDNNSGSTTVTGFDPQGDAVSFPADVSAWSNTFTDTINVSSAALASTTGTNKSQYLTLDTSLQAHVNADVNGAVNVRATLAQVNQKGHWEIVFDAIDALATPNGTFVGGINDSGTSFGPSNLGTIPRASSVPGCTAMVKHGSTTLQVYLNGTGPTVTLPAAPAVGDAPIFDHDYTAHTLHIRYYTASGSTVTDCGTPTMTGAYIPTTPYSHAGGYRTNDQFHVNFGASSWLVTPDTGFTYYA